MTKRKEPYRQYVPTISLSLERNTEDVPHDGWYYVIHNKDLIGRFKNYRRAQEKYISIRDDLVERKVVDAPIDFAAASIDRYLENKDLFWATSHGFRRRGGKGR